MGPGVLRGEFCVPRRTRKGTGRYRSRFRGVLYALVPPASRRDPVQRLRRRTKLPVGWRRIRLPLRARLRGRSLRVANSGMKDVSFAQAGCPAMSRRIATLPRRCCDRPRCRTCRDKDLRPRAGGALPLHAQAHPTTGGAAPPRSLLAGRRRENRCQPGLLPGRAATRSGRHCGSLRSRDGLGAGLRPLAAPWQDAAPRGRRPHGSVPVAHCGRGLVARSRLQRAGPRLPGPDPCPRCSEPSGLWGRRGRDRRGTLPAHQLGTRSRQAAQPMNKMR